MPAPQRVTFCRRRKTLFRKASALCGHAGALAAVIVFSSTGKLYSSDDLSVEEMAEIISYYVRCNDAAMPPMGPKVGVDMVKKEGKCFSNRFTTLSKKASELCTKTHARAAVIVFSKTGSLYAWGFPTFEDVISDWVEKQRASCVTKEDFDSLNLKYEAILRYVMREKLKDISGSGNSGVGAGCDSEVSNADDIDSRLKSLKACCEELRDLFKEYVRDGLLTAPVNSAVASGSSGKESTSTPSDLEGREFNPDSLFDFSSGVDENGCLILPGNSTGHGGKLRRGAGL